MVGVKFGLFEVLRRAPAPASNPARAAFWVCRCACGNERVHCTADINRAAAKSCGCRGRPAR